MPELSRNQGVTSSLREAKAEFERRYAEVKAGDDELSKRIRRIRLETEMLSEEIKILKNDSERHSAQQGS